MHCSKWNVFFAHKSVLLILQCLRSITIPKPAELTRDHWSVTKMTLLDLFNSTTNSSTLGSNLHWTGWLVYRQHLKGKKHKYNIKLYMLREPNGMILWHDRIVQQEMSSVARQWHSKHTITSSNKRAVARQRINNNRRTVRDGAFCAIHIKAKASMN
jgi:hypothetical protein